MASDGHHNADGESWTAPGAFTFTEGSEFTWDLGESRRIDGVAIQADNNDEYVIEISDDGVQFIPLWVAPAVSGAGLRTRSERLPGRLARFIRLSARGGDGQFSVSELEIFDGAFDGSRLVQAWWLPKHRVDGWWLITALLAWVLLFALTPSTPRRFAFALAVPVIAVAWYTGTQTLAANSQGELSGERIDAMRGFTALLAAGAVVRMRFQTKRPAHPLAVRSILVAAAILGVALFLNLGRPQFYDHGRSRATYLHHYDLRTYFPLAKYFAELHFDGVYAASALAAAELHSNLAALAATPMRDLRTHELTTVGAQSDLIAAVRARFGDTRWDEFKTDMAYFINAMGMDGFLRSMRDHGGNATPVWVLGGRAVFDSSVASDAVMWRSVILDVALLALAAIALWRAFGVNTALIGLTVFGAMDFYQFGSNWFGAPLRHDWLALWALSLCAMRLGWFRLGGGLLAWSTLIRAFPALAFVTLGMSVAAPLLVARSPDVRRTTMRLFWGAAAATLILGVLATLAYGPQSWAMWLHKVAILDRDNHLNNIATRTYLSSGPAGAVAWGVGGLIATYFAARRAPPEIAAAWGVALVPLVFNPANYYLHCFFLLVVLAREVPHAIPTHRGLAVWLILLGMCIASSFTGAAGEPARHFMLDTIVAVVTLAALLAIEIVTAARDRLRASALLTTPPADASRVPS